MALIEDALNALEAAIASSEERMEAPAPAVTTRIDALYERIWRLHCTCERLTLGASELEAGLSRDSEDSDGVGSLESLRLTDSSLRLTDSLGAQNQPITTKSRAASAPNPTSIFGRSAAATGNLSNFGNIRDTFASTPQRPSLPSGDSGSDSDGDLVAPTYGGVFAPNDNLGPMGSECSIERR